MKNLSITILLCFTALGLSAQPNKSYTSTIDTLFAIIKKLPSYKAQIKGEEIQRYQDLVNQLKQERPLNHWDEFFTLSKLFIPLKDNHLFFSEMPRITNLEKFSDPAFVKQYKASEAFKNLPKADTNLALLENTLARKNMDSVEGIYYFHNDKIKMGLFRTAKRDSLVGVVLESKLPYWEPGHIVLVLKEFKLNHFRAYFGSQEYQYFGLLRNDKFMHGSLTETHWKKRTGKPDYVNIASDVPRYQFKTLSDKIQYLRLGSFSSDEDDLEVTAAFFDRVKDSITSKMLIVDLRNNGGGGYKAAAQFMKLLQDYAQSGNKIYVLINNRTFSYAEQFSIRLRKSDNVIMLGETTNGTLAYGNNDGTREFIPGSEYMVYITNMYDYGNYVKYEDSGFPTDVNLDPASNWIAQTMNYIKANNK
ncbi:S41 family peptidase [Mucilaginibacter segetis]|uniref:Tail specific protease domain-containing protein n=1 Tax=Mucilaginibacter segetis TaxID=2793071 RepID=A0A934PTU7_9SPHI|nr:S41 family peptidase [Mucilaginibacter segetis]MBK0379452.1 hypothetical protein [Mucilaginibacter segetis]